MDFYSIEKVILIYNKHIYDRYKNLIDSGKTNELLTNNDLSKIFEYYSNKSKEVLNRIKNKFGVNNSNLLNQLNFDFNLKMVG